MGSKIASKEVVNDAMNSVKERIDVLVSFMHVTSKRTDVLNHRSIILTQMAPQTGPGVVCEWVSVCVCPWT